MSTAVCVLHLRRPAGQELAPRSSASRRQLRGPRNGNIMAGADAAAVPRARAGKADAAAMVFGVALAFPLVRQFGGTFPAGGGRRAEFLSHDYHPGAGARRRRTGR